MISCQRMSKRYPNGHQALHDLNLELAEGEMAFLTGHSGAGKTTLLKILSLIERPSKGQLLFNGNNITRLANRLIPYYRRMVGIVFQNPRLLMQRTVFDNVALPMIITANGHQEIKRRVQAALDKVGLLDKAALYPADLSGGEQQRVGIARAVVNRPPLLLADEPTGNLDPDLSIEIMDLFDQFNQVGVTVVVATHDIAMIGRYHHRIVSLQQGNLVQNQTREVLDEA